MENGRLVLFLLPAILSGCQKMDNVQEAAVRQFCATTETAVDATKTFLDSGLNILWNGNDEINLYLGVSKSVPGFVPADAEGKSESTIAVREDGSGNSGVIADPWDKEDLAFNAAYYPRSSGAISCQNSRYSISVSVPGTQTYAVNSFGRNAFHMVAVTDNVDDTDFRFRNVMGALRLQLTGNATISKIVFSGNSAEQLHGSASVSLEDAPVLKFTSNPLAVSPDKNDSVTLDCGDGVALKSDEATSFFIALAPQVFWNGFSALIIDSDGGRTVLSTHKKQTIARSTVLTMPSREYVADDVEFVDLGLSVKWAATNLGASDMNPVGNYFAWGETSSRGVFDGGNYSGPVGLDWDVSVLHYTLKSENDAATVNLGDLWRMPTRDEFDELMANCDISYSSAERGWYAARRGDAGTKVFFPVTGFMNNSSVTMDHQGWYWTSSLHDGDNSCAWCGFFNPNGDRGTYANMRFRGICIRPVSDF